MVATSQPHNMTVETYLQWEPCQELRYEFVDGKVFAMTGGTLPHNDIAINLLIALHAIEFPKMIIEVLSPGTEALDRKVMKNTLKYPSPTARIPRSKI